MRYTFFFGVVVVGLLTIESGKLSAATTNAPSPVPVNSLVSNSVESDLSGLVSRINSKLMQGKTNETELVAELQEFGSIFEKHKDAPIPERGQILLAQANLYLEVLNRPERAVEVIKQIKRDCPGLELSGGTDHLIAVLQRSAEQKKIRESLVVGVKFPDFDAKDLAGNPLSVSRFKGKVVLVDFWATWCFPCMIELPNVLEVYKKNHKQGFEIIGVSLDDSRPTLERFLKEKAIPWPQYFDGLAWGNKLVLKYGVNNLPATYLIDRKGKIIGKDLRGDELAAAVIAALSKK